MSGKTDDFEKYFQYLKTISLRGRLYKRYFSSPILYASARRFGPRVIEVGSGIGSGVLGAFRSKVVGLEINPYAVEFSQKAGLRASFVGDDGVFPVPDESFDACVLDNVIEHIAEPQGIFNECFRIASPAGGLVIAVPGVRGYRSDPDHRVFYEEDRLRALDDRWRLRRIFSMPFFFRNKELSNAVRQYCLVAVYSKRS